MSTTQPQIPVIPDPLNQTHLAQIRQALSIISQSEAHIMKAKQAGIDVSQQEASLADSKAKLLQIKNVYFPNS